MSNPATPGATMAALVHGLACTIADDTAITTVQTNGVRVELADHTWYDMTSVQATEPSSDGGWVDTVLLYGALRGVLVRHATFVSLYRVAERPAAASKAAPDAGPPRLPAKADDHCGSPV